MILQQTRGALSSGDQLSLDLPFALTKSLAARIGPTPSFTRASSARFVGSNGLIQSAGNNVARFDHDPVTLASRGLLIEESRTNLYQRSENFADAFWTKTRSNIQSDATTAPDGTTTADKLIEDTTASSSHSLSSSVTPSATPHTLSVFAKKGERNWIILRAGGQSTFFNLDTGVATSGINSPTITNYGNGWYRCTVTSSAGTQNQIWMSPDGITTSYTGDGTSGIFIWGAQLEAGSFATSYIPTTTASLVRSADVCTITGAAFSGIFNQSQGTLFVNSTRLRPSGSDYNGIFQANDGGSGSNRIIIGNEGNPNDVGFLINRLNAVQYNGNIFNGTFLRRAALAYSPTSTNRAYNGALGTEDVSSLIPTVTQFVFGAGQIITAACYYKKRLPNAKLQALTV